MPDRVPFVGGSYPLRRKKADVQRSINLMPTPIESGSGKSGNYLQSIPGLTQFSDAPPLPPNPPVFYYQTVIWTGNGATSRPISAINLVAHKGILIYRCRNLNFQPLMCVFDGVNYHHVNLISGAYTSTPAITFTNIGFTLTDASANSSGDLFVGYCFGTGYRFSQIINYVGDGTQDRQIPHALGVPIGRVFTMRTDGVTELAEFWDRSLALRRAYPSNTGAAAVVSDSFGTAIAPDATNLVVGVQAGTGKNVSGVPYTSVLFAHDTASDGGIQAVVYNGNTSTSGPVLALGWQPQMVWNKPNIVGAFSTVVDNVRYPNFAGSPTKLFTSLDFPESGSWGNPLVLVPNGYQVTSASADINQGVVCAIALRSLP